MTKKVNMTTTERVVAELRERPLTRPELSILIDDVTSRTILYQLHKLQEHGFVRSGCEPCKMYKLVTEEGLWIKCEVCNQVQPCWSVRDNACHYCRNMPCVTGKTKKKVVIPKNQCNTRARLYGKDDSQARAFHLLLRGAQIGVVK